MAQGGMNLHPANVEQYGLAGDRSFSDQEGERQWGDYEEARRVWEAREQGGDTGLTLVGELPWGWCYTVARKDSFLFVGNGALLQVLALLPDDSLHFVTQVRVTSTLLDMFVEGERLYAVDFWGLHIFDVQNPAQPVSLGKLFVPNSPPRRVVSRDSLVFLTTWFALGIVNVSNPLQPYFLGWGALIGNRGDGLALHGNFVYCGTDQEPQLQIFDVSNPSDPVRLPLVASFPGRSHQFIIRDTVLYTCGWRLHTFSIADPAAPIPLDSLEATGMGQVFKGMAISGDRAYVISESGRLYVYDISDPGNLAVLSSQPFVHRLSTSSLGMALSSGEERVYAAWQSRLLVFSPTAADTVELKGKYVAGGNPRDVRVKDGYAFIASNLSGVWVVDISNPHNPHPVGRFESRGNVHRLNLADTILFALQDVGVFPAFHEEAEPVWLVSVADPAKPQPLSTFRTVANYLPRLFSLTDQRMYLGFGDPRPDRDTILSITDWANPYEPQTLGYFTSQQRTLRGMTSASSRVYVATGGIGIRIIDVSDPSDPNIVANVLQDADGVALIDNVLYTRIVVQEGGGFVPYFVSVDITDLNAPIYLDSLHMPGSSGGIRILQLRDHLITTVGSSVYFVDVSDPSSLRTTYSAPGGASWVDTSFVYWASSAGFAIYDLPKLTSISVPPDIPHATRLMQNYPNPFNDHTIIRFEVDYKMKITIEIFDILGRKVQVLMDGVVEPGAHALQFDATSLASGLYLYRMGSESGIETKKMLLLR